MSNRVAHLLLDGVVAPVERRLVRRLRLRHRYPPLFVVGAPRSGTTLVYQHLARRFRFAFLPNASKRHPHACVTAAALTRLLPAPSIDYDSSFGNMSGTGAPSDGWDVFHRWFPRDDYSVPVDEARLHELRTIVACLERLYGAPFLNKNNSNGVRVDALRGVFPDAFFLHVARDLPATVDSLLRGRRVHDVADDEWWAAPPPAFATRTFADETERVVAQAVGLRRHIEQAFARTPAARHTTVDYDAFCARPAALERWVEEAYAASGIRLERAPGTVPDGFAARRSERAADPAFRERVQALRARLERELDAGVA